MLSSIYTASLSGLDVDLVAVETDMSSGLPTLNLVGLPGQTVRESKERIRSALLNSGYAFPTRRITVNLSPADLKKTGTHFDLPMAVGILSVSGAVDQDAAENTAFLGELSLDGSIGAVAYAQALVIGLKQKGLTNIFLPKQNLDEVATIGGIILFPVSDLREVTEHLAGIAEVPPVFGENIAAVTSDAETEFALDFADVRGQEGAKRALLICAAGRHDLSMCGPPGAGKTMLAKRLPSILPELSESEEMEVRKIYSIAGDVGSAGPRTRPFRAPHHSITPQALIGGGYRPIPGELSLAHSGVLFLDELPEFPRSVLDTLRQPLEDGAITISRATSKVSYPCDFILVTAMNPCPCGYFGHPQKSCTCTEIARQRYFARVSGPLKDRIDMHIGVNPVEYDALYGVHKGMSSAEMRADVMRVSEIQEARYRNCEVRYNAQLTPALTERYCVLDQDSTRLLAAAAAKFSFSARSGGKVVKVARTIADLEGSERICAEHVAEAIGYRSPAER